MKEKDRMCPRCGYMEKDIPQKKEEAFCPHCGTRLIQERNKNNKKQLLS